MYVMLLFFSRGKGLSLTGKDILLVNICTSETFMEALQNLTFVCGEGGGGGGNSRKK